MPHRVAIPQTVRSTAQVQGGTVFVDKDPTLWADGLEEELTPYVYSSLETAAYGLAVQLKKTMDGLPQLPRQVTILEASVDDMALLEHFRRTSLLLQKHPRDRFAYPYR